MAKSGHLTVWGMIAALLLVAGGAVAAAASLTEAEARQIALGAVNTQEVGPITDIEREREGGIDVIAVEFRKNGVETDVKIDARTGGIVLIENDRNEADTDEPGDADDDGTAGGRNCAEDDPDGEDAGAGQYAPTIAAKNFVARVTNPFFTLRPGTTYTYQGTTADGKEKIVVIVTPKTKKVLGIATTVVLDRAYLDGELIEETYDWYAQDREGNVWYFGEDSKEFEDGKVVSTEGSWEAGVDGAQPGIIMLARPKVGDSYRQEYYKGVAEDMADVVALGQTVKGPLGTFKNCLQTRDWSRIEVALNEHKYYCPAVGNVALEVAVDTGEKVELTKLVKGKPK